MAGNEVNVVGWYNKNNAGDEAYKLAFPILFNNSFVFSDVPRPGHSSYVLGGGDIIAPSFLKSLARVEGRKIAASVAFPEKVDRQLLQQFSSIIVRDQQSLANARANGVSALLSPDFAFCLQGQPTKGRQMLVSLFQKQQHEMYERTVGVVINAHLMPSNESLASDAARFDQLCYQIAAVADSTNASFVLIPFGKSMPWDDRASNATAASRAKFYRKNVCIFNELSAQETLDLVSALDCLVSTRLHSTIFAIGCGVPFLDITHNHKNSNLLSTLGLEDFSLPYTRSNTEDIRYRINQILRRREEFSSQMRVIAAQQRASLSEVVANVHLV